MNRRLDCCIGLNSSVKRVLTKDFLFLNSQGGKWKSWMFVLIICGSIFVLALVVGLGIACLRGKNNRDRGNFYSAMC